MEVEAGAGGCGGCSSMEEEDIARVRVKRKTLQAVLEQCQRALQSLSNDADVIEDDDDDAGQEGNRDSARGHDGGGGGGGEEAEEEDDQSLTAHQADREADELCQLLKSRFECPDFLEKLEFARVSVPQNITGEEGNSWDMVNEKDLWEAERTDLEQEDYVLVRQEDIVDGIACFMATYLLSLKQTKDLTPNQLQEALSKTFSTKKKKGKLRKAWEGSKVIYNVASWGATAIGSVIQVKTFAWALYFLHLLCDQSYVLGDMSNHLKCFNLLDALLLNAVAFFLLMMFHSLLVTGYTKTL